MTDTIRITCPRCRGAAQYTIPHVSGDPELDTLRDCTHCLGTGESEVTAEQIDELVRAAGVALSSMSVVSVSHPNLIPSFPVVGLHEALRDMGGAV